MTVQRPVGVDVPANRLSRQMRRKLEREGRLVPGEVPVQQPVRKPAGPGPRPRVVEVEPGYPEFGWRDELAQLVRDRAELRRREDQIAAQALSAGCTYSELARALGMSRQAVHARYRHLRPSVRA